MKPTAPRPKGLGPSSNGFASSLAERRAAGAASEWPLDAEQLLGPDLAAYMNAMAAQAGCDWTMVLAPALAAAAAALGPHATIAGKPDGSWTQSGVLWFLVAAETGRDGFGACAAVSHQLACYQAYMTQIQGEPASLPGIQCIQKTPEAFYRALAERNSHDMVQLDEGSDGFAFWSLSTHGRSRELHRSNQLQAYDSRRMHITTGGNIKKRDADAGPALTLPFTHVPLCSYADPAKVVDMERTVGTLDGLLARFAYVSPRADPRASGRGSGAAQHAERLQRLAPQEQNGALCEVEDFLRGQNIAFGGSLVRMPVSKIKYVTRGAEESSGRLAYSEATMAGDAPLAAPAHDAAALYGPLANVLIGLRLISQRGFDEQDRVLVSPQAFKMGDEAQAQFKAHMQEHAAAMEEVQKAHHLHSAGAELKQPGQLLRLALVIHATLFAIRNPACGRLLGGRLCLPPRAVSLEALDIAHGLLACLHRQRRWLSNSALRAAELTAPEACARIRRELGATGAVPLAAAAGGMAAVQAACSSEEEEVHTRAAQCFATKRPRKAGQEDGDAP